MAVVDNSHVALVGLHMYGPFPCAAERPGHVMAVGEAVGEPAGEVGEVGEPAGAVYHMSHGAEVAPTCVHTCKGILIKAHQVHIQSGLDVNSYLSTILEW